MVGIEIITGPLAHRDRTIRIHLNQSVQQSLVLRTIEIAISGHLSER